MTIVACKILRVHSKQTCRHTVIYENRESLKSTTQLFQTEKEGVRSGILRHPRHFGDVQEVIDAGARGP